VSGEHAGQTGRETGADDQRDPLPLRDRVEVEQRTDVVDAVGHRHHRHASVEERPRSFGVELARQGEDGDVDVGAVRDRCLLLAERGDDGCCSFLVVIGD
jgi:hypothetical protein